MLLGASFSCTQGLLLALCSVIPGSVWGDNTQYKKIQLESDTCMQHLSPCTTTQPIGITSLAPPFFFFTIKHRHFLKFKMQFPYNILTSLESQSYSMFTLMRCKSSELEEMTGCVHEHTCVHECANADTTHCLKIINCCRTIVYKKLLFPENTRSICFYMQET